MQQPRRGASAVLLLDGRVLVTGGVDADVVLAGTESFSAEGFVAAAPMNIARAWHSSVVLDDGRVLVAGGVTVDGTATAEAEIYDPATGSWTLVPPTEGAPGAMQEARYGHTASLLNDGRVLIVGGEGELGVSGSMEIFDPAAQNFSLAGVLSSPPEESRSRCASGWPCPHRGRLGRNGASRIRRRL